MNWGAVPRSQSEELPEVPVAPISSFLLPRSIPRVVLLRPKEASRLYARLPHPQELDTLLGELLILSLNLPKRRGQEERD